MSSSGTPGRSHERGAAYDERFTELAAAGTDVHGEANFVASLGPGSVLDAGCGTGRVAIELARRGIDVVGLDADAEMLAAARAKAPGLDWRQADLADPDLAGPDLEGRRFDVVVMAGNVMIFVAAGTEPAVVTNASACLAGGGALVAGFQITPGRIDLEGYDRCCAAAGLDLAERWSTWDRRPWVAGAGYAVSVHRAGVA